MLNGFSLNGAALNSAGAGFSETGVGSLITITQNVGATGLGPEVYVEARVGYIGSGIEILVEQDNILYEMGTGSLVTITQDVSSLLSGSIIDIEQRVVSAAVSHLDRSGWDCTFMLAGNEVDNSLIHGEIRITRSEGQAALMDITLIPALGYQVVSTLAGKTVTLDAHTSSGTMRLYTGVVDIPEIDLIEKKITLRCTDKRKELINSQLSSVVNTIGYYSPLIFQDVKDTADALERRLSTVPQSVDFDAYGNYTLSSLFAKATPDYTLTDADVYYRDPTVSIASRGRIVNKINISFQYRYERLHHIKRDFEWTSPISSEYTLLFQDSYSLTFRSMITAAIDAAGWPIQGAVSFTDIMPSGWYGGIAWSTVQLTGTTNKVLDSAGNQVLDAAGNGVTTTTITGGTNFAPLYCLGATWSATTRFTQTITENRTITVSASQSIAQYGEVEQSESYSTNADYDTAIWENYQVYDDTGNGSGNYTISQDTNRGDTSSAILVVLNKAKTSILASHRDSRVSISKFLWPEIDLSHTVYVNTTPVQAKGKVFSINHVLNIGTGEAVTSVSIALFQATGSAADSTLSVSGAISDTVTYDSGTITLGNHFGEDPTTLEAQDWNGYVGNRLPAGSIFRTNYTEQFIVDTPAISSTVRDAKDLYESATYNISIPNDTLTIIF